MFDKHVRAMEEKHGRKLTDLELEELKKQTIKVASEGSKPPIPRKHIVT